MNKLAPISQLLVLSIVATVLLASSGMTGFAASPSAVWQTEVVDPDDCWYPSLALDSVGLPRIGYGADGELRYAWYDGSMWHPEIVEDEPGSTGWYASLALDSLDNPRISYYSPYSETLMYAAYYSGAWHLETVGSTYSGGGQTSLKLDSSELPHNAYWDYTHLAVKYAYRDGGGWHYDTLVSMTAGGQSVSLALALDSADRPHLCYYDYEAGELRYAYHDGSIWRFDTVDDDVFYNGQNCSIALDSQDRPHISYRDLGLLYATRTGTAWRITTVDDDFFAGDGSSLALDNDGLPSISYTDWAYPDEELRYAYFTGFGWHIETVDTAAETRRFEESSLALDDAGRPHIGYWDLGAESVLKYAVRDATPVFSRLYVPLLMRH